MNKYLNVAGLTYLWGKIKALIATKADQNHTHTQYVTKQELQQALDALNLGFSNDESDMKS